MINLLKQAAAAGSAVMEAVNHSKNSAMEAENHVKHGACSKSLMSRENFLRKACIAVLAVGFIFSGCGKEDDKFTEVKVEQFNGTITATNLFNCSQYNDDFKTVQAIAWQDWNEDTFEVIATAEWSDCGFTMTLPSNPSAFFKNITSFAEYDEVTISDNSVNYLELDYFKVLNSDGDEITSLYYWNKTNDTDGIFMYVDKEVTITFTELKLRLTLKPGWNIWMVGSEMQWYNKNDI